MKTSKLSCGIGLGLLIFFLTGCGAAPAQLTVTAPVKATHTLTVTPIDTTSPSATPSPTKMPPTRTSSAAMPVRLLTPVRAAVAAHPLALNVSNVGTAMKLINTYGTGALEDVTFSPDGKYLAAATNRGIYLYDGKTFGQVRFINVNQGVTAMAFSPDGLTIAAAVNGKTSLWSTLSGKRLMVLDGELNYILTLAYGKGEYVAALGWTCRDCGRSKDGIILWDANTGKQIYAEEELWFSGHSLAFTSDGEKLLFSSYQDGLTILETKTAKKSTIGKSFSNFILSDDDQRLFATTSASYTVLDIPARGYMVEMPTQKVQDFPLCRTEVIRAGKTGVCLSEDFSYDENLSDDKVFLFDLSDGKQITEEINTLGIITLNAAALSPDATFFAYLIDNTLRIINIETGRDVKTLVFNEFRNVETGMIFLNGEQRYAAALQNRRGQVELIDLETSALLQTYALPNVNIEYFAFRPDGMTVATLDDQNMLVLWDIASQSILYQTTLSEDVRNPFTFSRNGLIAFFTDSVDNIFRFDFSTKPTLNRMGQSFDNLYGAPTYLSGNYYHFNGAGDLIFLRYEGIYTNFLNANTNKKISIPFQAIQDYASTNHNKIIDFAMNRDGKFLAFGTLTDIYFWDLATMKQIVKLTGDESFQSFPFSKVYSLSFSPQSNLLVTIGWDRTTRLWNINNGQELWHVDSCCRATFTADGRYLLTTDGGVLRVWGISDKP